MAMQIQRGLVKYKDRSDIICTYGVSPAGIQYYFLDEAKLSNGNIIVTTTLLEAVDPVAIASHVGVIDSDGNVVIQCVNKSVKPISSDILLVEKAQPTSQNVLDTIALRDDPNAATRLVTTPATIKDNINKLMEPNGRFVFNDQFSEATIYDIDGNNLVNDELYSFIGVDDKRIYFSKNTVDSEVIQYSLTNGFNEEENKVPTLNVETTDITKDVIEKALNDEESTEEDVPVEEAPAEETPLENTEAPVDENTEYSEEVEIPEENTVVEETTDENIIPEVDNNEYSEDVVIPGVEDTSSEENTEYSEEVEIPTEETTDENIIPEVEENNESNEEIPLEINTEYTEEDNTNEEVYEEPAPEEEKEEDEEIVSDRLEETPEEPEYEEDEEDDDDDSEESGGEDIEYKENYEEDNLDNPVYVEDEYDYGYENEDSYNNLVESYNYSNNNVIPEKNIFDDVTSTISNLVELNRNLQSMVDSYEIKLTKCDAARKKLVELSKSQAREISSLNARVARLEADKQLLEAKVNALTPAANGDLVRVMADAHNILGQSRTLRRNKNNY